ncbi:MAG TPA: CocE/NonD family hydrolase [Devosiaceae bacterium]|jgi:hypothetical protein
MTLTSRILGRLHRLPPRRYRARVTRNIPVAMRDGVTLATDHFAPDDPGPHPTVVMRLPYGKRGFVGVGILYAERGFHVVLQACRGTDRSGGHFDPLIHERADGLDTLAWIKAQPWFDGRLGTNGPSYLGYTQWAICDALPEISAMSTKITSAEFRSVVFPGGAVHLGLWLSWLQILESLRRSRFFTFRHMVSGDIDRRTLAASMTLPLLEADVAAVGREVPFWRHWFNDAVDDGPFWHAMDHRHRIGADTPPNFFMSGWYDFMIDQLLRDYRALIDLGHKPHLTVGPWFHTSNMLQALSLKETLIWMRTHLLGDATGLRSKPVRLHISGDNHWRDFDAYPPGAPALRTLFPGLNHTLATEPPIASEPDSYTYDPADPTPNIGGAMFAFVGAGPKNNAGRENRLDVLSYTSEVLDKPLTIIGNCGLRLYAKASVPHADFFVRLCDVSRRGVSTNICDGLIRVTPDTPVTADGWQLDISLHATAHTFRPGHRLRLQISSGAHPRFARNLGTPDPIGSATRMVTNQIVIFHDAQRPTALTLPTYDI